MLVFFFFDFWGFVFEWPTWYWPLQNILQFALIFFTCACMSSKHKSRSISIINIDLSVIVQKRTNLVMLHVWATNLPPPRSWPHHRDLHPLLRPRDLCLHGGPESQTNINWSCTFSSWLHYNNLIKQYFLPPLSMSCLAPLASRLLHTAEEPNAAAKKRGVVVFWSSPRIFAALFGSAPLLRSRSAESQCLE